MATDLCPITSTRATKIMDLIPAGALIQNVSSNAVWIKDSADVAVGNGFQLIGGAGMTKSSEGPLFACLDTGGVTTVLLTVSDALGSLLSASPSAVASTALTFIGNLNTITATWFNVTGFRTLWVYLKNQTTTGGSMLLSWASASSGGNSFGAMSLGGVGFGTSVGTVIGPSSGWVSIPVRGNWVQISGFANTVANLYASTSPTSGMCGYPDDQFVGTSYNVYGTGATGNPVLNVFGPCRMDYVAFIQDTTTKGYYYFAPSWIGIGAGFAGFCDTSQMYTDSGAHLAKVGSIVTPAGLSYVNFRQFSATAGGEVGMQYTLTPLPTAA